LYYWRSSAHKKASSSDRENTLATENVRLKRQLATQTEGLEILKKAATYFAKNQK
jgi:transposase